MKFHYNPEAKAETEYHLVTRTTDALCGAKTRYYGQATLIETSIKSAVTCTKCKAALIAK